MKMYIDVDVKVPKGIKHRFIMMDGTVIDYYYTGECTTHHCTDWEVALNGKTFSKPNRTKRSLYQHKYYLEHTKEKRRKLRNCTKETKNERT